MIDIREGIAESAAAIGKGDLEIMFDILYQRFHDDPTTVLEVGLFHCGLTALLYRYLNILRYVGIDNNSRPEDVPEFDTRMNFLWEHDSNDPKSVLDTKEILGNNSVDFLFIDGGHQYNTVFNDYEMYSPLVHDGGIIGFHDIHLNSSGGQVKPLWDRLKTQYQYVEISCNAESTGIGLLFKNERLKIVA